MSKADLHRLIDSLSDDVVERIEAGEPVTVVTIEGNGGLELREIDPEQAWFWTPEWQAGEREADAEIEAGLGTVYEDTEQFLAHLDRVPPASR